VLLHPAKDATRVNRPAHLVPRPEERLVSDEFSKGDKVAWKSHGGEAVGKVEKKITEDTNEAGRTVRASEDDPQYLVMTEKSGGEAVHKPSALHEK
jgi:hypothetical protein